MKRLKIMDFLSGHGGGGGIDGWGKKKKTFYEISQKANVRSRQALSL